ncbi:hypothetical protein SMACR_06922 [Sordaria macrospora]|uniref:ADP-ribosylation factor 6 n=1 Tax=Sordaria macrospora TaxID=5147 RepID=A0A8S8ZYF3_SORMA|nr:hypothetical protein SMACR_06922 [Sordaria macrospora]
MGNVLSLGFMAKLFGTKEVRVLMLGLDAAGKTTILYKLKLQDHVTTIPTVGFNVETVTLRNIKFNIWDVGGQDKIRPLWRHYYSGTQGLIFVVDSADHARIDEARVELHRIINDREMKDCLLLVFANKQDIAGGTFSPFPSPSPSFSVIFFATKDERRGTRCPLRSAFFFSFPRCARSQLPRKTFDLYARPVLTHR